jgi:uncharacterized protein YaiL (DUF2058 family)
MGNPFRDKFLKAGLVSKKQVNKAKREKHIKRKENTGEELSAVSQHVQHLKAVQAKQNHEMNQKREQAKIVKEQKAQIKQLIEQNRLEQDSRGEAYHFVQHGKITRIFVADEMIDQLSCGQLAIVKFGEKYEVVPAKVAEQIAERKKTVIVSFHKKS